ncbi:MULTISPECIES: acetate--CoA ligase [unclassified Paenibacillus]|uniref:acetate--CoA ligase n=1 Tax=unclassified Paenibacillus TaxID=185978 RepID=UPI00240753AF|nr:MULTISPECIES: acetate--CoA ligase [unclassified Paenibacillus]MDF9842865.1 acetyl-CoA synthetase [Paenibacillus sp. PastF-2]MDF9849453.1 acetyl-CoA synthetase [Paenibacillus sp. PastM-2]MDF9856172.1 acetyl-CoA synthetase [Paenibacillus sp. PastF-1]MDH6481296.1 acetyl-CoA synthetase [Paenibacillus sp. PastH-2]MDH6508860.1 acetyl-CoA synthetase [Paenibacillus sp. PastM-3]
MGQVHNEILPGRVEHANLRDYTLAVQQFRWEDVERTFSWYHTGKVNMAHEAIDRHVSEGRGAATALIYSDLSREERYTFSDLQEHSSRFGNVLRKYGVGKGERVFIFMPRSPELYFSLLGVLRVGAVAGPLFEAFMETAVKDRLEDSGAVALVTTPELLKRVRREELPALRHIIVVGGAVEEQGIISYEAEMAAAKAELEPEWLTLEDGLIMHYTSGSTGKPKGVYHAQRAMIQHYYTGKIVLDLRPDDIYWCTADPGWVTGTSYGIFAPWLNGVANVVRGGRFSPGDWYRTIERFAVTVWYSAPTAFRMLMGAGENSLAGIDLGSLRHVLSVGEPLNPEVVRWGDKVYRQRIHDTWWMTETGAQLICNYPGMDIKPGSMGRPLPGIEAAILDDRGNELPPYSMGNLAIRTPWPSMMAKIWNNQAKYDEYFRIPGWYISGDSAYMDEDGYFWFQGRIDDVINSSGERIGPFEVESKLVEHPAVAEAGVIGKPDLLRGEIIKAFISLREGYTATAELKDEIAAFVKAGLSAHAAPREIEFKEKLPKTRSGKIMRRVLKAWELQLPAGDLSTIED